MTAPTLDAPPHAIADATPVPRARRRRRLRRSIPWIAIAIVVLGGIVVGIVSSNRPAPVRWGPDDPSPDGSKAYAQVLRDRGVRVTATTSLAETRAAIRDPTATTLVLADDAGILAPSQLRRLHGIAAHTVLLQPGYDALDALAPDVTIAGSGRGVADGCRVGGLERTDRVTATGRRYLPAAGGSATVCLGDPDTGYGLVRVDDAGGRVDVVGAGGAVTNGHATEHGNAACALGLLGETRDVVWYVPGVDDLPPGTAGLPSELLPGWWPPVFVLLVLVVIAAAVWRGRRFGPLAVENLPVIVPASETMEGRGRLYARSSARVHALDALRIGAIGRLASACGLPRQASVDEVVDAVAAAVGRPRGEVEGVLRGIEPADDTTLVDLSEALTRLERDTRAATRGR